MNKTLKAKNKTDETVLESLLRKATGPCASIQLLLSRIPNMRKQNAIALRKAITKINAALETYEPDDAVKKAIAQQLENLEASFDNDGSAESIGLYAGPDQSGLITFPFKVNEIAIVADSFETRDLRYLRQYLRPYKVISFGKQATHLFRGCADSLEEIKNEFFPMAYSDDYEYERSSIGSSVGYGMKGFEKDKGIITDIRLQALVKEARQHLSRYMTDPTAELIVTGPSKLTNTFVEHAGGQFQIAGIVSTTFNAKDYQAFTTAVWEAVDTSRKKQISLGIARLENLGLNYKASGLRKVWEAANKGKGLLLLVERDFQQQAYRPENVEEIRLHPPEGKYTFIADAVDDAIEKVAGKNGRVLFTEPHQLSKFEGIALILRY